MKKLVCYFSASGVTRRAALEIASIEKADIFEIEPSQIYSKDDLNWMKRDSRSSLEMKDSLSRPKISNHIDNVECYDTVFIGFPIWWDTYPRVINTFVEENNLKEKKIILFATSGGSDIKKSVIDFKKTYSNLNVVSGKLLSNIEKIKKWLESLEV